MSLFPCKQLCKTDHLVFYCIGVGVTNMIIEVRDGELNHNTDYHDWNQIQVKTDVFLVAKFAVAVTKLDWAPSLITMEIAHLQKELWNLNMQ